MTNEEKQQKLFHFRPKIKSVSEFSDTPVEGQDGQQIKLLTQQMESLSNLFSNKFDQQVKANERLSSQVSRLSNSVGNLTTKIEDKVVHDKKPDLVISPFADPDAADVSFVDSPLPAEAYYPCSTNDLAKLVDLTASRLGRLFHSAGIQGNPKFHYAIVTGKSTIQRYKPVALKELLERAKAGRVDGMKQYEIEKIAKYIRLQQIMAEL